MSALRVLVNGARGRMGRALVAAAQEEPAVAISAEIDVGDDFATAVPGCDVIVDFSHHSTAELVLARSMEHGKRLVIGTTGHSDLQVAAIRHAAGGIPIVFAPNYSVGVNTLFWLAQRATEILGSSFDPEIVEMHHRLKKDAPSGTAKRLAEIVASVRGLTYNDDARHGRVGMVGERSEREIGVHAVRGGDVVGDHTVIFAGPGERVELVHKASSRETFARGAIRAAIWASTQPPGLYDMQDVLGLR